MNKIDAEFTLTCTYVLCVCVEVRTLTGLLMCVLHELLARCAFDLPFKC